MREMLKKVLQNLEHFPPGLAKSNFRWTGLISPNHVADTTLKLNSGYYIIECYVKMSNGIFHTSMGMAKELIVSDTNSGNEKPKADIDIEISSTDGIVFNDSISKGIRTFSVHYKDQIVHEHFLGHDVNLAKIDDNVNLETLAVGWIGQILKDLLNPHQQELLF